MSSETVLDEVEAASAVDRPGGDDRAAGMLGRFQQVRSFSQSLCATLEPEDYVVQSMPDVSPTKWHLAHTSWFFETFILKVWMPGYQPEVPEYAYLFNSYYNAAGDMHRRDLRGLISRPTVAEAYRFRRSIDQHVQELLESADHELIDTLEPVFTIGLQHEQQHQELLVTDIKHVFAQNPLHPIFRERNDRPQRRTIAPCGFVDFEEAIVEIGHGGRGFSYDNEGPRHRALVGAFSLATRPVTNGEYIAFIEDGGYKRPDHWLSLGWTTVNQPASGEWEAPLYWTKRDGNWWNFTLSGMRPVDEAEPVTHVSHFEADAFANWSGARLPTEFEWERAAAGLEIEGNFVDTERFQPAPVEAQPNGKLTRMFGDVWEWTRSAYLPYPGYRAEPGALGEYNGKFMSSQMVLRGGSCATSQNHIRPTYRNFFQPEKRWQFTGIRLARDPR
ncbi:MAG: ergothioneine biosynthesis protein EgtB [Chthoniobacterales bacterium]|nr:ergothioneine biosynthesis protein EgtB [Chthoniobacterales bacterium]